MCGICGIITKKNNLPEKELIQKMMDKLYHRGPDGRGWFRDRKAALGHTRLSIIDINGGSQPQCNEDESKWISYNGEIYNYVELHDELVSLGHIFKTKSDTEVILHAWESWREGCFERFNGQWAIAIWDRTRKELILSRDRYGIRPLYYTQTSDKFLFASEIKALFADESINRTFSSKGLQENFTFWGPLAPSTVYDNVYEIPPGCFAVFLENDLCIKPYWEINFPNEDCRKIYDLSFNDKAMLLKDKLTESARLRFERSDVPVGAYLSGGIDSSVSTAIVNRYAKDGLKTFSIRFSEKSFDEGYYQNKMVNKLGTDHQSFIVEPEDIGRIFPEVIYHTERPISRTAPAPLFLLSRLVKESGFKVVVTGEGADEVLGGYDIFREAFVRKEIAQKGRNEETENLLMMLYPWMGDSFKKTPAFTRFFFSKNISLDDNALSHRPRWDNFRLMLPIFSEEMLDSVKKYDPIGSIIQGMPNECSNWSYLGKAQWLEYKTLLSGYILSAQGDRMLMANSVEGRFPFLDKELNDFANMLPSEMKLRTLDLDEKKILKEAFRNEIPTDIINRPKQPYQSPNFNCFLQTSSRGHYEFIDWVNDVTKTELIKDANIFNPIAVSKLKDKCLRSVKKGLSHGDNTRLLNVISTMITYSCIIKDNISYNNAPTRWAAGEKSYDFLEL